MEKEKYILQTIAKTKQCCDEDIRINHSMATHLAKKWLCEPFALPSWDTPVIMDSNLDLACNYFFFGNLINFGINLSNGLLGPVGDLNYWLKLRCNLQLLSPISLSQITSTQLAHTLGNLTYLEQKTEMLRQAARALRLKYNGEVKELYETHHWNVPEISKAIIKDFPGFNDTVGTVPFMRRTLLTLFMTHARFQDNVLFSGLETLSVGADVQVFNGLLNLGVLEISSSLSNSLATGPIIANEELEFTIRCQTVCAAEVLLGAINSERRAPITSCQLDYFLRQVGTSGKVPLPLALSTAY